MTLNIISEIEVINKYLGIPYKHRGRDMTGLDCYGLIIAVYKDFGEYLLDIEEEYDVRWDFKGKNYFIENYNKEWDKIINPIPFDVVLFKNSKGICNHGGIVFKDGMFLHTCKAGTVMSRLSDWQSKLDGYYRLKARYK